MLAAVPSGGSARRRVLIVDDEPQILAIVRDALVLDDYEVIEATGGAAALAALARAPEAILLDLWMPDMDGWTFRRAQLVSHPAIPVIVFSAVDVTPDRLAELRPAAVLSKPFDLNELYRTVARVLSAPAAS